MHLKDSKLALVDVETTGISPEMGDRIFDKARGVSKRAQRPRQASQFINLERSILRDARSVRSIADAEVSHAPRIKAVAQTFGKLYSIA